MNRKTNDALEWTPPDPDIERRWVPTELRTYDRQATRQEAEAGGVTVIDGLAYTHDWYVLQTWWGQIEEKIAEGAASKTLKDGADVRSLLNHNPDKVLGRTKSGTLELSEEKGGLRSVTVPDLTVQHAADAVAMIRRGDIDQMSFAFEVVREQWTFNDDPESRELDKREILELKLYDTSPVTFPANEFTSVAIGQRSMERVARIAAEGSKRAQRLLDRWRQRFDIAPGTPGERHHSDTPGQSHLSEPDPSHLPEEERSGRLVVPIMRRIAIARLRALNVRD